MRDSVDHETYELMTLDGNTVMVGRTISLAQRRKASELLKGRTPHLTAMQRIAVVDAMAFWLGESGDDELALALAEAICADSGAAGELTSALGVSPAELYPE